MAIGIFPTDLAEERDNPGRVARACARIALYGGAHPYGLNPLGTDQSIAAMMLVVEPWVVLNARAPRMRTAGAVPMMRA